MRRVLGLSLFLFALSLQGQAFVRIGAGWASGEETTVRDVHCNSANPPALFGCGYSAEGEWGSGGVFEAALGFEVSSHTRFEIAVSRRAMDLDADANFLGAGDEQPVTSGVRSVGLMVNGAVDLVPQTWRVRPYVTAGVGLARNSLDEVVYAFPAIGPQAVTVTRGGTYTDLARSAGIGATLDLSSSLALDLVFRRLDLGEARTAEGAARIVRPTRELTIDVAATRAELETSEVVLSVRWRR